MKELNFGGWTVRWWRKPRFITGRFYAWHKWGLYAFGVGRWALNVWPPKRKRV